MSAEDLQLIDNEKIDDSIKKRDFKKNYHDSGANFEAEKSQIKFYFGEIHKFVQVGNGYLGIDTIVRRANGNHFNIGLPPAGITISLVDNAFGFTNHDARISTSAGVEIEQNKYVGPIRTNRRSLTQKDGDSSTYFDIIGKVRMRSIVYHWKIYSLIITLKLIEASSEVIYLWNMFSDSVDPSTKILNHLVLNWICEHQIGNKIFYTQH